MVKITIRRKIIMFHRIYSTVGLQHIIRLLKSVKKNKSRFQSKH